MAYFASYTAGSVRDKKHFTLTLKRFLTVQSFYLISEYLNYRHEMKTDDSSIRNELQTLYIFSCNFVYLC